MTATTTGKPIRSFTGVHGVYSNFSACSAPVFLEDDDPVVGYRNTEYAYQAAKGLDEFYREHVRTRPSSGSAKAAGGPGKVVLRPGWDLGVKDHVMLSLLRQKFHPAKPEGQALRLTGERHLEEGNRHGDRYWGTVGGEGKNMLGLLLMQVRGEHFPDDCPAMHVLDYESDWHALGEHLVALEASR